MQFTRTLYQMQLLAYYIQTKNFFIKTSHNFNKFKNIVIDNTRYINFKIKLEKTLKIMQVFLT